MTASSTRPGVSVRRLIMGGAFALSAVAAPALIGFATPTSPTPAHLATCSGGEEEDVFTTTCMPYLVPNSPSPFTTNAANPDIPEIDGIPCTGHDSGACIGLAEDAEAAGPPAIPRTTISSSP